MGSPPPSSGSPRGHRSLPPFEILLASTGLGTTALRSLVRLLGSARLRSTLGRATLRCRFCLLCHACLGLLGGLLLGLLPKLRLLRLLLPDVVQRHADDGLLELLHLARPLLGRLVGLALLVHAAPGLCPSQLHRLDALVEQGIG